MALRAAILGSTGSVGRQALDVASRFPDRVSVVALTAHSSSDLVREQIRIFEPHRVAMGDPVAARSLATDFPELEVGAGPEAIEAIAASADVDLVLNALVGAAGLRATLAALGADKTLALANKESLVVGGELVMKDLRPGALIPVDSEHSAIYQCLLGERAEDVSRIWLTASGGPFRGRRRAELAEVSSQDALAHPTWAMGPKITIDSATLMNKGLEAIEAHHLFGLDYEQIRIAIHPESCVHSMVEFADGSVKAHLGATDMRIPIQYALSHPERWASPVAPIDFTQLAGLHFEAPDLDTFGCLRLALEAGRTGGTMPAVMNAANEVAVAAFLQGQCRFLDIESTVAAAMNAHEACLLDSLEQVEDADAQAREFARTFLKSTS